MMVANAFNSIQFVKYFMVTTIYFFCVMACENDLTISMPHVAKGHGLEMVCRGSAGARGIGKNFW